MCLLILKLQTACEFGYISCLMFLLVFSHLPTRDSPAMVGSVGDPSFQSNGRGPSGAVALGPGLSHVTQIGNNTGSLPGVLMK